MPISGSDTSHSMPSRHSYMKELLLAWMYPILPSPIMLLLHLWKDDAQVLTKRENRTSCRQIWQQFHRDVWGPYPTKSLGGEAYYISFMDDKPGTPNYTYSPIRVE